MHKSIIAFLAALCLLPAAAMIVQAEEVLSDDIVILYTNDIHTHIDGELSYDVLAAVKQDLQTQYRYVLLADAGDHIQGTAYGSMDNGETIIRMMNAVGYDVATLGNHEFDYRMDGCLNILSLADYPYVSCNFYREADGVRGDNVLSSYVVFDCGKESVAFVGITTPDTFFTSTPAYFQDENGNFIYGISASEDGSALRQDVQKAIDDARADGATTVIALGHLGVEKETSPNTSRETIAGVSGLDAFIDGHSHTVIEGEQTADKDGNSVLLTQTGEYFSRIGMMVIDADTGEITTDFIEWEEVLAEDGETVAGYTFVSDLYTRTEWISDAETAAIKNGWITEINSRMGQVLGSTSLVFDNYDADGNRIVRYEETNTGDFTADALYYLFDSMDMDVDLAIMNGGGIRNKAVTGELSYLSCKTIHSFGNVACLQTVTGQQILDALEWGARYLGKSENGGFLQVSGLTYKVDTSIPDTTQVNDIGAWCGGPAEYRVHDVKVYNKETDSWDPLDLKASYNLAGYNYTLRDLGDGFAMFGGAVNVLDYVMEDYLVLAGYISAFENGTVEGSNSPLLKKYPSFKIDYANPAGSGRIAVEEKAAVITASVGGLDSNIWMTKYGNVYTDCTLEAFTQAGFSVGDLVTVRFLDQEITMPVVPAYSYVDYGKPAIITGLTDTAASSCISMAVYMGNFAETYKIAIKKTEAEGNWWWEAAETAVFPVTVAFTMAEKGGYQDQVLLRSLSYSLERRDYPHLTDSEYANFRAVGTSGMGDSRLYRTSSPINPANNRNTEALAALKKAGATVIMNLAEDPETAAGYASYEGSYYADQKVIYLNLGVDVTEESFRIGLARGLRFFAENKGVYAVHCTHGKDRAGFVSALLECLMGASLEEVVQDYMTTYYNYYGITAESENYGTIADVLLSTLCAAFETDSLENANLAEEAAEYILSLGLTDSELAALRNNLGKDNVKNPYQSTSQYWVVYYYMFRSGTLR